jgi:Ca-activated chloride channel family protein
MPASYEPLTVTPLVDRHLIRASGEGEIFFGVQLRAVATAAPASERPALNLALVLDRSGSMARGKLDRAREAALFALRQLIERDYVGIVAYDDVIELVAPSQRATPAAKRAATTALQAIHARGSTNLHDGWLLGLQQIASQQSQAEANTLHRCFLLTDGLANQGITDHDALVALAAEWRTRGVVTTAFGVGEDFDEHLLEDIAEAGGGYFHFIAEAGDIPNYIKGELGELLAVVARDITLDLWATVERPGTTEHATFTLLNRLPLTVDAEGIASATLGDLDAGGERLLVARVTCPRGSRGETVTLHARLRYAVADRQQTFTVDLPPQTLTYELDTAVAAQPVDEAFMAEVLLLQAADARDRAEAQLQMGDVHGAAGTMHQMALAMMAMPDAMQTPEVMAEAASLDALAEEGLARGFTPIMRKVNHGQSYLRRHSKRDYANGDADPTDPNAPPKP